MLESHQQASIAESACHAFEGMARDFACTLASIEAAMTAPHVLHGARPKYNTTMKQWVCETPESFATLNVVYGQGATPAEAAASYDKAWRTGNNRMTPASSPEGSPSGAG